MKVLELFYSVMSHYACVWLHIPCMKQGIAMKTALAESIRFILWHYVSLRLRLAWLHFGQVVGWYLKVKEFQIVACSLLHKLSISFIFFFFPLIFPYANAVLTALICVLRYITIVSFSGSCQFLIPFSKPVLPIFHWALSSPRRILIKHPHCFSILLTWPYQIRSRFSPWENNYSLPWFHASHCLAPDLS